MNCTQMTLSEVLNIGFRTYVRYEAGQRDAPVAILIKFARLSNVSLDRLLTMQISKQDLNTPDVETPPASTGKLEVIGGSLQEGRLSFKGLRDSYLISTAENEKKLVGLYRKMDRLTREKCVLDVAWLLRNSKPDRQRTSQKPQSKEAFKAKNTAKLKRMAKSIKKITLKG